MAPATWVTFPLPLHSGHTVLAPARDFDERAQLGRSYRTRDEFREMLLIDEERDRGDYAYRWTTLTSIER
jgi:hypothetical protein